MKAGERRKAIAHLLMGRKGVVSGGKLAEQFGVSRQVIVQDIIVLKAAGYEILSTHNGYVLQRSPHVERVFKVRHSKEQTEDELMSIVRLGGTVANVFVWHRVYGKIAASLNIFSEMHVRQFIEGVRSGKSSELMNITDGYHYHTICAESEEILDSIGAMLEEKKYLVPEIQ